MFDVQTWMQVDVDLKWINKLSKLFIGWFYKEEQIIHFILEWYIRKEVELDESRFIRYDGVELVI